MEIEPNYKLVYKCKHIGFFKTLCALCMVKTVSKHMHKSKQILCW